jgi:hypothetical protein
MVPPIVFERLNRFSPHFAAQFLLSKVQSRLKPRQAETTVPQPTQLPLQ